MVFGIKKSQGHRRSILFGIAMILFLGLFLRFFDIQVRKYQDFSEKSSNNSVRNIKRSAPRGIIYDRNGIPSVDNRPTYDLSVIPIDVTGQFNYGLISNLTGLDSVQLKKSVQKEQNRFSRFKPFVLKRHVEFEERSRIEENKLEFPGVLFSAFPARTYPNQAHLTHVLGYLRTVTDEVLKKADPEMNYQHGDIFGFSGLEHIYERILRGIDGVEFRLVDIYGIDHGEFVSDREYPAIPGKNFYVTIDSRLQILAESLMDGKKGAIIAMDPNSGDVLSYVSAPEYDLNSFVGPIPVELWNKWNSDPDKPLMNRTIQGTYPPGSIFKLIMAAYTLENRIVSSNWKVQCNGAYTYGDRTFHCWNTDGHGSMDMINSIKYSCNIFYYHLIQKIKFENWTEIVKEFGFSSKTGLDLPGEKRGIVPTRDYMNKKYGRFGWANGSLLNFVIGQGDVLATPLQVVQIMNLVATKGSTYQPRLNNSSVSNLFRVDLSTSTWKFLEDATFAVVNEEEGTGRNAKSISGIVRGKTSTVQNPHGEDHSWFSGYITLPTGEIMSLAVIVENGGKGSGLASKISRELFNTFVKLTENGSITL